MYERLINFLQAVEKPKVLLAGDFMLDNYLYGDINRISPEAPVMILNVSHRCEQPGGAGSVAMDLVALGAEIACLGVIGDDDRGRRLQQILADTGQIDIEGIIPVKNRPTTMKQRVVGLARHRHQQQLLRIDDEEAAPVPANVQEKLKQLFIDKLRECNIVCLEDYDKGLLQDDFCRELITIARDQGKRVIIDPARIKDYRRYEGAWLIKPNRGELELAGGMTINDGAAWSEAASRLARKWNFEYVALTLDKQGTFLYSARECSGELLSTRPRNVYDVTGAGDMVLAMLGLLLGGQYRQTEPPEVKEMVMLANIAGGLEVERFGCVGISREEIIAELSQQCRIKSGKFRSLESLLPELEWHRQQQHKIVFTNGCYDILHPGHVSLLEFARDQGDILIVAINSDRSVKQLKGDKRPILNERERAIMLSSLAAVDYVIIFDELDPGRVIERITPDILIKGSDWTGNVVGQEWVEQHGGEVRLMPLVKGKSTTNIIERVVTRYTDKCNS